MATTPAAQQQPVRKEADAKSPLIRILENLINMINSGVGRDKMCRIIQYTIMAFLPYMKARGAHMNELVGRLSKLKSSMSMTRKVLRFGKEIPLITGIRNKLALHEVTPQRAIFYRVLSDLTLILYFFTDHPLYLHNVGFWKYSKKFNDNCDYINNVFWLVSSLFDIVCTVVEIQYLNKQIKKMASQLNEPSNGGKPADEQAKQQLRGQLREHKILLIKQWLNFWRNVIDLPAIFHFMGSKHVSATAGGLCGAVTSAISLYGIYGSW